MQRMEGLTTLKLVVIDFCLQHTAVEPEVSKHVIDLI